jgi:hypothetical protein
MGVVAMSDGENGRSSRLRERRKQSKEKAQDTVESEPDEPEEQDKPSKPSKPDKQEKQDKTSVKDEQVGTYIYLPEWQRDDLRDFADDAQYHYRKEHGVELEKNRHVYPLVVQYGLDALDATDASDLHEKLTALDRVPTE